MRGPVAFLALAGALLAQIPVTSVGGGGGVSSVSDVTSLFTGTGYLKTDGTADAIAEGPAGPAGPVGPAGPAGADGAAGVPGYSPNSLLSGGAITWTSGFSFKVSAASYLIGNTQYSSAQTDIELTAPDAKLDRIDVVAVDDTGTVVVVEGTAAETPAEPTVDPATQLKLTSFNVNHGQSAPLGIATTYVYQENAGVPTEWDATVSGAGMAAASTSSPITGTYSVLATAATSGQYVQFAASAPFTLSTRNNLTFAIKSTAAWNSKRSLQFYFATTGVRVGSIVTLNEGAFGFSSSSTAVQNLTIPLSLFAVTGTVNQLRITVAGSQTAIGFRLDDITLQGGIIQTTAPASMSWAGAWNAEASYAVNSVVTNDGSTYVALTANVNSEPPSANWVAVATASSGAPADAHYLTTQAETGLSAESSLGALADNSIVAVDVAAGVATPRAATSGDLLGTGTTANVALVSNGSNGIVPATGTVSTGGTGISLLKITTTTIGGLASITVANGYDLAAGKSTAYVTDGASCGDTTVGSGSVSETLRCTTVVDGACTAWAVIACGGVAASTGSEVLIARTTLEAPAGSFVFSDIPQTYKDLILRCDGRQDGAIANATLRLNGDATGAYDYSYAQHNDIMTVGSAFGQTSVNTTFPIPGNASTAGYSGGGQIMIYNYSGTTFYKHGTGHGGGLLAASAANSYNTGMSFWWRSTSAVTSVTYTLDGVKSFLTGSTCALLGAY